MKAALSSAVLYEEYVDPAPEAEAAAAAAGAGSRRVGVMSREVSRIGDARRSSLPRPDLENVSKPYQHSKIVTTLTLPALCVCYGYFSANQR